ncbi:MAG: hypothetical protein ACT4PV_14685 [Planctomycetaceae bacterium]
MRFVMRLFFGSGRATGDPCGSPRRVLRGCPPVEPADGAPDSLAAIVADYVRRVGPIRERERALYADQPSLIDAIRVAAMREREDGRRAAHERRISRAALPGASTAPFKQSTPRSPTGVAAKVRIT